VTAPADFDALELFRALGRREVAYVTVGGVAIQAYGSQRMTQDLDVAIANVQLGDLSIPIAHRDDLLTMKRAAGRPQDLADVRLLESLDDEP